MEKRTDEIRAAFNTQTIKMFLEEIAEAEKKNRETFVTVVKGNKDSFAQKKDDPYVIEVTRPVGANKAADKSFVGYLHSIFGNKAKVEVHTRKLKQDEKKVTDKVRFKITGTDENLIEKIKEHRQKAEEVYHSKF